MVLYPRQGGGGGVTDDFAGALTSTIRQTISTAAVYISRISYVVGTIAHIMYIVGLVPEFGEPSAFFPAFGTLSECQHRTAAVARLLISLSLPLPRCVPLPGVYFVCAATLSSADRSSDSGVWYCCETLELVIELAEACPSFLRPRLAQCVNGMVQVRGREGIVVVCQDAARQEAVCCLVSRGQ